MLNHCCSDLDVLVLEEGSRCRHFLHIGQRKWLHLEILRPEIDCRFVGAEKILGQLLERRRSERMHRLRQALYPADEQKGAVLDVVIGVMVGDENRADGCERDACTGELVRDAEPAIDYIRGSVAHHHVRSVVPRASRYCRRRSSTTAKNDEFGS